MKKLVFSLGLLLSTAAYAGGGGSAAKPLQGMYPIVLSHGLFGWGDSDPTGLINVIKLWGGMDDYLRSQGAAVYAPAKSAANSNEVRARQLKEKVLYYMAANGLSKVHIVGHSQGALDSRYMIANLGMAPKVATYTSLAGPHRGSPVANVFDAVLPDWLKPYVSTVIGILVRIVYGQSEQDAAASLAALTTSGMSAFNAATPDVPAVKYFSYAARMTWADPIQHPSTAVLHPICGLGGIALGLGFDNDGLVNTTSAKWGHYRGEPSYPWTTTGIDHGQIANNFWTGQNFFDVEGFFLKFAKEAKVNQ